MDVRDGGRRYSGYDEYEGIFGSLGSVIGSRGSRQRSLSSKFSRSAPSTSAATSGYGAAGGRTFPASRRSQARHSSGPLSTNGYERRQRYLNDRVSKRRLKSVGGDDDAEDDHSDDQAGGAAQPSAPKAVGRQPPTHSQICLPTKNFTFRQRAGKLDTRTIARLDLQKIVATTDVEAIQRHLENLAFSDVTLEDVQQYSDTYFLKLFQIAQLTLEYLLNVQDSLASHCENLETQCEGLNDECQTLELENHKVESEILAMKKEIRQKQSTLATFEMMLLHTTASKRASQGLRAMANQENDPAVLNLLGVSASAANDTQDEIGAVPLVSACVMCGKKFISPEYLLRHQQKKHRDAADQHTSATKKIKKKNKHQGDSSASDSSGSSQNSSSANKKKNREQPKTAPLPAEVIQALNERNELTKQLGELQYQLRSEKERRIEESKLMEQQQTQLTTQLTSYMAKLQDTLVEMEKKQEQSKHEMMRYTQETVDRLKAERARENATKKSNAGRLQNDGESDGESHQESKTNSKDVEKRILDTLLRGQAEMQHKNAELEQANRKLQTKLKRKARQLQLEPLSTTTALMTMAALDAQRFGIDRGVDLDEAKPPVVMRPKTVALEDKPVQTDEEREDPSKNKKPQVVTQSQLVQTEVETVAPPAPVIKSEPKLPIPAVAKVESKIPKPKVEPPPPVQRKPEPAPTPVLVAEAKEPVTPSDPPIEKKTESKLQHAAHVVGKVALGFLARKVLKNPSNWLLTLPASSLLTALSDQELTQLTQHQQAGGSLQDITIEIEDDMTANDLRVAFADALSGDREGDHGAETEEDEETVSIDYHRILLHHRHTGQEISGDQFIYHLRNQLEVEIIPRFDAAESHVNDVLDFHGEITSQLRDIRRASMDMTPGEFPTDERGGHQAATRIQSIVRRFLAYRCVEMMKIDRLVEARLLSMRTESSSSPSSSRLRRSTSVSASQRRLTRSASVVALRVETTDETTVSDKAQEIHQRLADLVKHKTGVDTRTKSAKWSRGRLSTEDYERHVDEIELMRSELPTDVRDRIQQISERMDKLVEDAYDPHEAKHEEDQYVAASRIQLALQVAVARKKLKQLLETKHAETLTKSDSEVSIEKEKVGASMASRRSDSDSDSELEEKATAPGTSVAQAEKAVEQKEKDPSLDVEDLDDTAEIKRLADAYEKPAEVKKPEAKPIISITPPVAATPKPVVRVPTPTPTRELPPRAGTPPPSQEELLGRSPRPKGDQAHVISPFSKTPLLSRRPAVARRGSGYDNAR